MLDVFAKTVRRGIRCLVLALVLSLVAPALTVGQGHQARLNGAFAVTIAAEDVPPELIGGASLVGRWRITFADDGAYVLARQDVGPLVHGSYEIDGSRLSLRGETGVIACEPVAGDDASAVYEWEFVEGRLLLVAVQEPCDRRRLLLTTRSLSSFVECPPLASELADVSRPDQHGTGPGSPRATPPATPGAGFAPTKEIDTLLKQMSDCWATREPERFLPLLSQEHRADQTPETEAERRRYVLNMGAPIVWDLAGDVELMWSGRAMAPVRQTLGDNVDVVRYAFVYEDGYWRWDGVADPESP